MAADREALSMPSFDEMDDFAPRTGAGQGADVAAPAPASRPASQARRAIDAVSHFPSREASPDAQLNLKGPRPVLDRFRKMCREDRRAYYDMLEILMDHFEGKSGQ